MTSSHDVTLQTGIPVLGVVENMSGLRQRADALRFFLPASTRPHSATSSPAQGGATEGPAVSPTDAASQGPVGQSDSGVSAAAADIDVTEQVLAALRQVAPQLEVNAFFFRFCTSAHQAQVLSLISSRTTFCQDKAGLTFKH